MLCGQSLIVKCRPTLFAHRPFFVENSSTIGTASAIIARSSVGPVPRFGGAPPLRTGAGAAIIDKSNQVIQTAHRAISRR